MVDTKHCFTWYFYYPLPPLTAIVKISLNTRVLLAINKRVSRRVLCIPSSYCSSQTTHLKKPESRRMREIFCPAAGLAANYPSMLRHLYSINDLLKKDGILAPSDASLTNTSRLYDLIGRPLDKIPTLHIGGTNGKVSTSQTTCNMFWNC